MRNESLTLALISDVFFDNQPERRLRERLGQAKAAGAELAVLSELPLNPWSPATRQARTDDEETPNGPRCRMMADAARSIGIGLVGGAIVRDPSTGNTRRNTALIFNAAGELIGSYCKCHLPEEPGFWETSHYEPGDQPSPVFDQFGVPLGVQICSDSNRPECSHILGAQGAELIIAPRATELGNYPRWRIVFQANAITSCLFIVSANRPRPEQGVPIGGPSIAVDPNGKVLLETSDPVGIVTIDRVTVRKAKANYPGFLPVRADLYARAWREIGDSRK